jgi:membrane protein DedA with SNARE-associated domain
MAVASTGGVAQFNDEMHRPLFVPELFGKALVWVFGAVLIGFAGVTWLSGPINLLDIGGTLLCAVLFAYLVHLLILVAKGSKAIR